MALSPRETGPDAHPPRMQGRPTRKMRPCQGRDSSQSCFEESPWNFDRLNRTATTLSGSTGNSRCVCQASSCCSVRSWVPSEICACNCPVTARFAWAPVPSLFRLGFLGLRLPLPLQSRPAQISAGTRDSTKEGPKRHEEYIQTLACQRTAAASWNHPISQADKKSANRRISENSPPR